MLDEFTLDNKMFDSFTSIDTNIIKYIDTSGNEINRINYSDTNGLTPLCYAALNGLDSWVIIYLLMNNADASKLCDKGKTPLQMACMAMNKIAIASLTKNTYNQAEDNKTPIFYVDNIGAHDKIYIYKRLNVQKTSKNKDEDPQTHTIDGYTFKLLNDVIYRYNEKISQKEASFYIVIKSYDSNSKYYYSYSSKYKNKDKFIPKSNWDDNTNTIKNDNSTNGDEDNIFILDNKYKYDTGPYPSGSSIPVANVTKYDLLSASKLPSADCLKAFIDIFCLPPDDNDQNNSEQDEHGLIKKDLTFTDSNNYNCLCYATLMQCYESVDLLLQYDKYAVYSIFYGCGFEPNNASAWYVANKLGDNGLINKFYNYDKEEIDKYKDTKYINSAPASDPREFEKPIMYYICNRIYGNKLYNIYGESSYIYNDTSKPDNYDYGINFLYDLGQNDVWYSQTDNPIYRDHAPFDSKQAGLAIVLAEAAGHLKTSADPNIDNKDRNNVLLEWQTDPLQSDPLYNNCWPWHLKVEPIDKKSDEKDLFQSGINIINILKKTNIIQY